MQIEVCNAGGASGGCVCTELDPQAHARLGDDAAAPATQGALQRLPLPSGADLQARAASLMPWPGCALLGMPDNEWLRSSSCIGAVLFVLPRKGYVAKELSLTLVPRQAWA